jgi:hypothetical protein
MLYAGGSFPLSTKVNTISLAAIENWLSENTLLPKPKNRPVETRKELTEDEEELVDMYDEVISKESVIVQEALANRLYSRVKKGAEDE